MKFSIRDLLLVTVIVALAVGWWVEHRRIAILERERDEVVNDAKFFAKHGSFRQSVGINGETHWNCYRLLEKYKVDRSAVTRHEAIRGEYILRLKDALRKSLGLRNSDELPPELEDELGTMAMDDAAAAKVLNSSAPTANPGRIDGGGATPPEMRGQDPERFWSKLKNRLSAYATIGNEYTVQP